MNDPRVSFSPSTKPRLGWREWASLPDLKVKAIKVKVDTGARTSALHATQITYHSVRHKTYVRFKIHPLQDTQVPEIDAAGLLLEERQVVSSHGHSTFRPTILTRIQIGTWVWPIELTLVNRDIMGFRMLVGRQALKKKFLIDPGASFLVGKKNKSRPRT
jgi:hypothetical protein